MSCDGDDEDDDENGDVGFLVMTNSSGQNLETILLMQSSHRGMKESLLLGRVGLLLLLWLRMIGPTMS